MAPPVDVELAVVPPVEVELAVLDVEPLEPPVDCALPLVPLVPVVAEVLLELEFEVLLELELEAFNEPVVVEELELVPVLDAFPEDALAFEVEPEALALFEVDDALVPPDELVGVADSPG